MYVYIYIYIYIYTYIYIYVFVYVNIQESLAALTSLSYATPAPPQHEDVMPLHQHLHAASSHFRSGNPQVPRRVLSLSLSLAHTHTHTHTHTRTNTREITRTHNHTHIFIHAHTLTHLLTLSHMHAQIYDRIRDGASNLGSFLISTMISRYTHECLGGQRQPPHRHHQMPFSISRCAKYVKRDPLMGPKLTNRPQLQRPMSIKRKSVWSHSRHRIIPQDFTHTLPNDFTFSCLIP